MDRKPRLPRTPYEMLLEDYVYVSCNGYLPHEFRVQDIKKELLSPKYPLINGNGSGLKPEDLNKFDKVQIYFYVIIDFIFNKNEKLIIITKRTNNIILRMESWVLTNEKMTNSSIRDVLGEHAEYTIYLPEDCLPKVENWWPGDMIVIQGVLRIDRHSPRPEYIIDAKWAKSMSHPIPCPY